MEDQDPGQDFSRHTPFALGDVRVDPPALRIERGGISRRVEAKVMQVLLALAREPGQVVSRRDLEAEVWPGRVVTDDAVTNTIGKLRRALGDNRRQPRFIETISKSGYRLKVEPLPAAAHVTAKDLASGDAIRRQGRWAAWAIGATVLAVLVLAVVYVVWQTSTERPIGAPAAGADASIAVIPFDVLGDDPAQAYFAEGITLDLITELSRFPELLVIAPGSVFGYRETSADDRAIAAELGVRYLIRGGVQRVDDRVRINVRLLQAERGLTLWAERFVGQVGSLFQMQEQVVRGITSALPEHLALSGRPITRSGATDSIAAYDAFLRGLERYGRRTPEDNRVARDHFERAIALDPGFARAYAGLALAWSRLAIDGWTDDPEAALAKAAAFAEQAASIDPSVPQIHFVRGQVALFEGEHERAAAAATKAIELNPNYADAYALLAWILHYAGRPDQAERALAEALRRNPKASASYDQVAGEIHFTTGHYEEAVEAFEAALRRNPAHTRARLWLAAALAQLGRTEDAAWEVQELLAINPDFSLSRLLLAFPLKDPRQRDALTSALTQLGLPQ